MAYRKGGTWVIRVPQRAGAGVLRGTGTPDKRTAQALERMVSELKVRRDWEILDAITGGERRGLAGDKHAPRPRAPLTLGAVFDAWRVNDLDRLRSRLADVDVEPLIVEWQGALRAKLGEDSETVSHYLTHVRSLIPAGVACSRAELTYRRIVAWLAELKVSDPTRRKYRAALMNFTEYLVRVGVLDTNPVREVKPPKAGAPRQRHLDLHDVLRLVERQEEPFRTLSALVHGTGMEISAALRVKRSDVDKLAKTVRAHGTKTHARDRTAYIAEWAWPYVERHMATLTPGALLFPGVDRWRASDEHRAACKALGETFEDYRLHDARHTYAVRAIKAGAPFEHVAAQLGHADTTMVVKVYGRYKPSAEERRAWEQIAAAQDAARAKGA